MMGGLTEDPISKGSNFHIFFIQETEKNVALSDQYTHCKMNFNRKKSPLKIFTKGDFSFKWLCIVLSFNITVNNFSVMSGQNS